MACSLYVPFALPIKPRRIWVPEDLAEQACKLMKYEED